MEKKIYEVQKYIVLDYSVFESLVHNHFPSKRLSGYQEWSFVADEEGHNDSVYRFNDIEPVVPSPDDKWDWNKLTKYYEQGEYSYMARTFLEMLCYKKVLPAGNYLIEVSW